jgi:hypothetical protein
MDFLELQDAPTVIAIRLDGKIVAEDMEEISRRVEDITSRGDKVRIYVEVKAFPTLTWEALKEDLGLGIRHFRDFEAKIVVTDMSWTDPVARVFDAIFPSIDLRVFPTAQRQQALAAARGEPTPT